MDRDTRTSCLGGRVGLVERLLVSRPGTDPCPVRDQHSPAHALEAVVLQPAATRLGPDRNSVSLAFDRRADIRTGTTFSGGRLASRALPALGDIRRASQSDNRPDERPVSPRTGKSNMIRLFCGIGGRPKTTQQISRDLKTAWHAHVVGVPLFNSWETAVSNCAGAKGFAGVRNALGCPFLCTVPAHIDHGELRIDLPGMAADLVVREERGFQAGTG
jgi:hypothetical protein